MKLRTMFRLHRGCEITMILLCCVILLFGVVVPIVSMINKPSSSEIVRAAYPVHDFSQSTPFEVVKVIDGDTIKVRYGGLIESVRLLGVDTPETVHPRKPVEHYGPQASVFVKNLLQGEHVYLRQGSQSPDRDKYNRLLCYVYRAPDGLFVNLEIVRQGYGKVYSESQFNLMDLFMHYQFLARNHRKGLWKGDSHE